VHFLPLTIEGAYQIEPELLCDERGFFARTWSRDEFAAQQLCSEFSQCSLSYNRKAGTLRGMHLQIDPHQEVKLVRCTRGSVFDVVLDLRPESATFLRWQGVELSMDNRRMLYIPEGCAHGFLTLADDTEFLYQIHGEYQPESARGVRWNDPAFAITWSGTPGVMSERDANYPDFVPTLLPEEPALHG